MPPAHKTHTTTRQSIAHCFLTREISTHRSWRVEGKTVGEEEDHSVRSQDPHAWSLADGAARKRCSQFGVENRYPWCLPNKGSAAAHHSAGGCKKVVELLHSAAPFPIITSSRFRLLQARDHAVEKRNVRKARVFRNCRKRTDIAQERACFRQRGCKDANRMGNSMHILFSSVDKNSRWKTFSVGWPDSVKGSGDAWETRQCIRNMDQRPDERHMRACTPGRNTDSACR